MSQCDNKLKNHDYYCDDSVTNFFIIKSRYKQMSLLIADNKLISQHSQIILVLRTSFIINVKKKLKGCLQQLELFVKLVHTPVIIHSYKDSLSQLQMTVIHNVRSYANDNCSYFL